MKQLLIALILNFGLNKVEAGTTKENHQGNNNGSHRIREVYHNLSLPGKVYMIPTFASSILIPCVIEDVLIGQAEGFSYLVSKKSPKRLEINTTTEAQTTNLIVYCSDKVFVFDLIIQSKTHNDVVILGGSFGGPEVEMQRSKYQDEFVKSENKTEKQPPASENKELQDDKDDEQDIKQKVKVTAYNTIQTEVYNIPQNKQSIMKIQNKPQNIQSDEAKEPLQPLIVKQEVVRLTSPTRSYLMTDKKAVELFRAAQLKNPGKNTNKTSINSSNMNLTKNPSRYFETKAGEK